MAKTTKKKQAKKSKKTTKYIFVVGGVISGVGKGVATASIAKILEARGVSATALKIDPYVNVDAGTMNPTEHGEVFVLRDGYECDQDLGNYERFLDTALTRANYMTTGRVYSEVIAKERNLEYEGKCVQVVPHIPEEVIRRIKRAARKEKAEVAVIEIGGTVGEYENILFLEAARMMKIREPENVGVVMLSYLPVPPRTGEMKTKPTQHAVRTLGSAGLRPDALIARSTMPVDKKRKEKLATFCNLEPHRVISAPDVDNIYEVPLNFEKDKLGDILLEALGIKLHKKPSALNEWRSFVRQAKGSKKEVHIAIVGKYFDTGDFVLSDAYISVIEAIKYSAFEHKCKPIIHWLSAEQFERAGALKELSRYDGLLVPGGFGERGIKGKLNVIEYAREKKIPYFGLCYGMQLLVVEFARNVAKLKDANTVEIDERTKHPVVDIMPEQKEKIARGDFGGTMRLGAYPAKLKEDTVAHTAYNNAKTYGLKTKDHKLIKERHRHRYEVNPKYIERLEKKGLVFSGTSPDGTLMEIAELPREKHPFFVGTQFHPEFEAHPLRPHPLFSAFIEAAVSKSRK